MEIKTVQIKQDDQGVYGYIVNGEWSVPPFPDNVDYAAVQEWIAAGNAPDAAAAAPPLDTDQQKVEHRIGKDPVLEALVKRMARLESKTTREVIDELKAEL